MKCVVGIDIGGSTTKIVGYSENAKPIDMLLVKATDPVTSVYGAFGKFLKNNNLSLDNVGKIVLTGVGSSFFSSDIFGVETKKIEEFVAVGLGGLELTGLSEALIVSMGTGTALVRASNNDIIHIGGSGLGGGTITGLCTQLLGARNFDTIIEKAQKGDLKNVDLAISDISKNNIKNLLPETTASNFGKVKDKANPEDVAIGVINMIFQTIGMLSVFSCRNDTIKDVVLTGTLTKVPQAREIFDSLMKIHDVNFIIPNNAIYATAIGAAISEFKNK